MSPLLTYELLCVLFIVTCVALCVIARAARRSTHAEIAALQRELNGCGTCAVPARSRRH